MEGRKEGTREEWGGREGREEKGHWLAGALVGSHPHSSLKKRNAYFI